MLATEIKVFLSYLESVKQYSPHTLKGYQRDLEKLSQYLSTSDSQDWKNVPNKWTNVIGSYISNDGVVKLGNHRIDDVLHYVEDEFLTDKKIKVLEGLLK